MTDTDRHRYPPAIADDDRGCARLTTPSCTEHPAVGIEDSNDLTVNHPELREREPVAADEPTDAVRSRRSWPRGDGIEAP